MRIRLTPAILGLLALSLPVAALANVTGTTTLAANTALNMDTGTTASSGGDLLWSGTALTPQGSALAFTTAGLAGASVYAAITPALLSTYSSLGSKAAIPASSLTVNTIVAVKTNGGNYGALMVTAVSGTSITIQYETFVSTPSGPTITEVENNYDGVPAGFSNSGIAQGAIFFVVGTGLATPGTVAALQDSTKGLPTSAGINGAVIKVTVGSTSVTVGMYYAQPTAVAGVMPSNMPLGAGTVTVSYGGQTSNAYPITVVASGFGFDSYNEQGTGLGIATTPNGVLYNYGNSIPPGTTVVLWGSGLGADPKGTGGNIAAGNRDTIYVPVTSVAADSVNGMTHIYVGGVDGGAPGYQGASGYPGLNQVNFKIPDNAPTGCNVAIVGVNALGIPTNVVTLPIGNGACSDPTYGSSGSQLQNLLGQTNARIGTVGLFQITEPGLPGGTLIDAFANFQSYSGSAYGYSTSSISLGSCTINQVASGSTATTLSSTGLDAGTITVTGPSGTPTTLTASSTFVGESSATLPSGSIPATGGTFTIKGAGGANVGQFTANVVFSNPLLNWTNQASAATVTRSAGLPITWTGGTSGTYVTIIGNSTSTGGANGSFSCIAPVSAGQFTVPSYILQAMPAGTGTVVVDNTTNFVTFTASGLDFGATYGYIGVGVGSTFN